MPRGTYITWTGHSYLSLTSGQGTGRATFKGATGNGNATVSAKLIANNGEVLTTSNRSVWVGTPPQVKILGFERKEFSPSTSYTFSAYYDSPLSLNYQWTVKGDARIETNMLGSTSSSVYVMTSNPREGGGFGVYLTATNACGSTYAGDNESIRPSTGGGDGNIEGIERRSAIQIDTTPVFIQIYSFPLGQLVYSEKESINFNINDTKLSKGIYIIHKTDSEGNMTSEKVSKQ